MPTDADAALLVALTRYRAVCLAAGNTQRALWADGHLANMGHASQQHVYGGSVLHEEVVKLVTAVETYIAECTAIGHEDGLARGTKMRDELSGWASSAPVNLARR